MNPIIVNIQAKENWIKVIFQLIKLWDIHTETFSDINDADMAFWGRISYIMDEDFTYDQKDYD